VLALLGVGCFPWYAAYRYDYSAPASGAPEVALIEARLAALLESEGYEASLPNHAFTDPAYRRCRRPSELVFWGKRTPPDSLYHSVYQFRCAGQPWFFINARLPEERKAEAARMRARIDRAFAAELANGTLHFSVGHSPDFE
jgi:hypothetical protein